MPLPQTAAAPQVKGGPGALRAFEAVRAAAPSIVPYVRSAEVSRPNSHALLSWAGAYSNSIGWLDSRFRLGDWELLALDYRAHKAVAAVGFPPGRLPPISMLKYHGAC